MVVCTSCGRELEHAWKYCIYCGAALDPAAGIPGAIRPEPAPARRGIDLPLLIGVVLAAVGVALVIGLATLFMVTRG